MAWSEPKDRFPRCEAAQKPFLFDPTKAFSGEKTDGFEPSKDGVYKLGHLARDEELTKLSYV